ncbi:MAG: ABC transporter substrate-binding protein [Clostridiales bacterium]|nr:ABC transporter substrate-binding protein [Clostridiales bacterium]
MKKLLSVLLGAAMVLSLAACGAADDTTTDNNSTDNESAKTYKVGIVNYVDDPSLAQIQAAVEAELDAKGQELGVTFSYADYTFNAQGDQSNLNAIAADLINDEVDLIIPIATPSALVIQNATAETGTPVVFSAVSDPVGAGLAASMDAPGSNITGTSDALDTQNIFNLIEAINPELDKVGLLYDASQDSSTQAIADAEAYLTENGIAYTAKTGTTTDDLALAVDALIADGCTVVFTPTDNTVQVAEPALYQKFIDAGVQHYGGADSFALVGAFCGYGVDYENLGTMTADLAVDILVNGKDPATTPVQTFDNGKASINTDTCAALGLDYETVKAAIEPMCTSVEALTTGTAFAD